MEIHCFDMTERKPSETIQNFFNQYKKIDQAEYARLQYPNGEDTIHYPPYNHDYGWMKLAIMKKFVQDKNENGRLPQNLDMIKEY